MLVGFALLYMLPTVIAVRSKSRFAPAAALVNIFFGLTVIGWVVALVLAVQGAVPKPPAGPPPLTPATVEGWYRDPFARYEQRYFDGNAWTAHVSTAGTQGVDPVAVSA